MLLGIVALNGFWVHRIQIWSGTFVLRIINTPLIIWRKSTLAILLRLI